MIATLPPRTLAFCEGTRPLQDAAEVERALTLLAEPNAVFEVRCLDARLNTNGNRYKSGVVSGYFNNAAAAIASLANVTSAKGVYVTLNPVQPALLARRANRLDYAEKGETTSDPHIERRRFFLLDVDAERPSGISATKAEKEMARKTARTIYKLLKDQNWPDPVIADSANGVHLLYRVDLPAEDGGLLQKVLAGLADYFDGGGAKVDRTVYNPARIVRLYGTLACKGDNTEDRPHRTARLMKVPDELTVVSEDRLRALLAVLTPAPETKPTARVSSAPTKQSGAFDVAVFLSRYGVAVKDAVTEPDGTRKWLLVKCPFNTDHVDGEAAVFQRTDGVLGFKCFHNGCDGKHWQDFRNFYEPNRTTTATADSPSNTEWPEPKDLPEDLPPVPAFNFDCLPDSFRPWQADISERMQCPPDFSAVAAIVALGSVIGRKIGIRPKRYDDWVVVPTVWGAFVGGPGMMKTPAAQQALVPLRRLVAEAQKAYEAKMAEHATDSLLKKQRQKITENKIAGHLKGGDENAARAEARASTKADDSEPKLRRYEVNDSTVAKLGELLAVNTNGLCHFRDELSGFLRGLDKEGNEEARAFFLEAWDGTGSFTVDRIGRGTVHVKHLTLSILGGIQPDLLTSYVREAVHGGGSADGLLQRFQLFVWPDISKEWRNVDRWPDTAAKNEAFSLFKYLDELTPDAIGAECPKEGGIPFLRFTPEAQYCFDQWRAGLEAKLRDDSEHPAFEAHLSKYRKLVPSLALLLHLAERGVGHVTLAALDKSLLWARYLEQHARRIYSAVLRPDTAAARELAKHLLRGELAARFTLREVYRRGWAGLSSKEDAQAATEILCDAGWIRPAADETERKGGRPASPVFDVSPRLVVAENRTDKTATTPFVISVSDPVGVSPNIQTENNNNKNTLPPLLTELTEPVGASV